MTARRPLVVAGGKPQQQQAGDVLALQPAAAASAGLNLGVGVAPTAPQNGDVWATASGVYAQINGATVGPLGPASSSYTPPACQNVKARVLSSV
jgi:hypothetical protein